MASCDRPHQLGAHQIRLGGEGQPAREAGQLPLNEALGAERVAQREAGWTEDFRQGVIAFLQKRPPSFDGS